MVYHDNYNLKIFEFSQYVSNWICHILQIYFKVHCQHIIMYLSCQAAWDLDPNTRWIHQCSRLPCTTSTASTTLWRPSRTATAAPRLSSSAPAGQRTASRHSWTSPGWAPPWTARTTIRRPLPNRPWQPYLPSRCRRAGMTRPWCLLNQRFVPFIPLHVNNEFILIFQIFFRYEYNWFGFSDGKTY